MGPYFIKSWVPIGSLFLSLEVPISFGNSANRSVNCKVDWGNGGGRPGAGLKSHGDVQDKKSVLAFNDSSLEVSVKLPPTSSLESREYNWKNLLKEKEQKLGQSEEIIEISDDDDEDGDSKLKKRRHTRKPEERDEYDLEDSFIDDEENHDENVPDKEDTELGGFYINRGNLYLKNSR